LFKIANNESTNKDQFITVTRLFEKVGVNIPEYGIIPIYRIGKFLTEKNRPILIKLLAYVYRRKYLKKQPSLEEKSK